MKYILLLTVFCFLSTVVVGQNYQIQRSTISAGGGTTESASYRISTSIGDPSTNVTSSTTYQLKIGMYPIGFNQPPTDITSSSLVIDENQVIGTSVGTLTTADPETNDTHIYTLVAGVGDTDNASFSISADALKSAVVFDFETKDTYSIRLQTDDGDGGTFQKEFTITIININDDPTDLTISVAPAVDENLPAGQVLGTFTASTDQDIASSADTHTYSLPATLLDNDLFSITGVTLSTNSSFDFETQPTLTIRVRTTDSGGLSYDKDIVVTINDANDPPTGFDGTNFTYPDFIFPENLPVGTLIATLSSIDEDAVDTYTYSLVAGAGDADNSYFQIVGSDVQILNNLDFERVEGPIFHVRLQTQDFAGAIYSDSVSIDITNVDEAPTAVDFVGASPPDILNISEDIGSGSPIAFLVAVDEDAADVYDPGNLRHTYELTAGVIDNSTFSIEGNLLKTAATLNFSIKSIYNIIVRVTELDDPALQYDQTLRVNVVESGAIINSSPIGLSLSNTTLLDNALPDDITGTITSTDPDDTGGTDTYTYALVAGTGDTDNASFLINGDQLLVNTTLDALVQNTYSVRIRTTDASGGAYDQAFTINIVGFVNTPPTDIALSNATVSETDAIGTPVGTFTATDGDANEVFTYALVAGIGETDNASFSIVGDELQTNATYDYLIQNSYSIRVQVTDNFGGTFEKEHAISILDTRAPLISSLDPSLGALEVDNAGTLFITFNELVNTGIGNIIIYEKQTDNLIESISVASANVTGSGSLSINIDPTSDFIGGIEYYVTIDNGAFTDIAGNTFSGWLDNVTWSFTTIDNVAPVISFVPTPATYLTQGGSTDVAVTIADASAVIVYFHSGGIMPSSSISASQIDLASGAYTASITDAAFDAVGLQYFFTATDGNGNTASSDTLFMYLSLTVNESITGLKFGGKIEDYQIIAFPYLLNNNKIIDVFSNFGSHDKTKWRLLHYNGSSGAYDDFPEFTTVEMGKGYWFNAVDQAEVTLSARDYPVVNNKEGYSLSLNQGWNQIGNPFTVDLDWNQVLTNNNISEGVEIEALWVYEAGPSLTLGNKLKAYRGGFVKANQIINLKLFPGTMNSGGRIVDDEILANSLEEEAWVFPFTLKKAQYQYNAGYIGMHPEAMEGKDRYDLSAAPRFIKHLDYHFTSVSTTDQQTGQVVKLADSYEWEFIVNTNLEPGIASIHWPTEKIGNNTLLLFDTETQRLINMSAENKYEFNLAGQRKFKVLFNVPNEDILPDKTLMGDPYPNPTNNITYIPLTLAESKSQEVEMKVYSLVGNEVASIYQGELENGFHKLKWNAIGHTGEKVQSGIYVIRLIVRDNDQYKTFIKRVLIN